MLYHQTRMSDYLASVNAASCGTVLRGLHSLFPPSLLAGRGWERVLGVADELPATTAKHIGFEFRLNNPVPDADFFAVVHLGTDIERHVVGRGEAAKPGSAAAALGWCMTQLKQPDSSLSQWADLVILEYDLAEVPAGEHPEPGVFLRLRRSAGPDWGCVTDTLATAVGWPPDPQEHRQVERVFAALPEGAGFMHVGAMPDRTRRAIRLVVAGLKPEEVLGFLTRLCYPGPLQPVEAVLSGLGDVFSSCILSFDVTQRELLPRLGLEFYVARGDWVETRRSDWLPLIARLEELDWCSSAKAHGLRSWPGSEKVYGDEGFFLAYQGINHVKITVEEAVTQAKAYCGLSYAPLK